MLRQCHDTVYLGHISADSVAAAICLFAYLFTCLFVYLQMNCLLVMHGSEKPTDTYTHTTQPMENILLMPRPPRSPGHKCSEKKKPPRRLWGRSKRKVCFFPPIPPSHTYPQLNITHHQLEEPSSNIFLHDTALEKKDEGAAGGSKKWPYWKRWLGVRDGVEWWWEWCSWR